MARAGGGWQGGLRALTCAGLLLLPPRATPRPRSGRPPRPSGRRRRSRSRKASRRPWPLPGPPRPAAPGWSAEVSDRGIGRDRGRNRRGRGADTLFARLFRHRALPVLPAGRPLPGNRRHPGRELPPAQGGGPAGTRPDPGLPLRPVRTRQVAHRHRYQGAGARGGGRDRAQAGLRQSRASISTSPRPTGRAFWPSFRRPRRDRRRPGAASRTTSPARRGPRRTPSP